MNKLYRWKLYFDKDKEETWLNEMAQNGWGMKSFFMGRYTFEPIEPGEYIYRIDLLPSNQQKKEDFFAFLREEMEVEIVQEWGVWFFCRRKAEQGHFELYSDADSRANHYRRIARTFMFFSAMELVCALFQLPGVLTGDGAINLVAMVLLLAAGLLFLQLGIRFHNKEKQQKN